MSSLFYHQWGLFFISEGLIWILMVFFLLARYLLRLNGLSLFLLLLVILGNGFQLFLGSVDYYFTGKVSFFQVFIILFIIYASTLGQADFKRLDRYIKQKVLTWQNKRGWMRHEMLEVIRPEPEAERLAYRKYRRQLLAIHILAYLVMHTLWFMIDVSVSYGATTRFDIAEWMQHPHRGWFHDPFFNILSYVWSLFLIYDLAVPFTYGLSRSQLNK
ncbi:hypothetical protein [Caldalkalibacillus salinus]|uniref:hypothetical protein n=1 Tax=Caldalkalibacillus salinus TaxID=2803787 RepID=UPI001922AFD5|nr:hypothetical protein [Caldalkalibacillus salinus]